MGLNRSWLSCERCAIGRYAFKHVLGRGIYPCDLLFIGEAPGKSENVLGQAFIGPAGKMLDKIIRAARERAQLRKKPNCFITNLLACRPCDSPSGKNRAPSRQEIGNCAPRLAEIVADAEAVGIVFLGRYARDNKPENLEGTPWVGLFHPSYVLRQGGESSAAFEYNVNELARFMKEVLP